MIRSAMFICICYSNKAIYKMGYNYTKCLKHPIQDLIP